MGLSKAHLLCHNDNIHFTQVKRRGKESRRFVKGHEMFALTIISLRMVLKAISSPLEDTLLVLLLQTFPVSLLEGHPDL